MAIKMNDRVAALVTVVTDGNLEVLKQDPFAARFDGIMLQTFLFEPAGITVVELSVPVARVRPTAGIDHWIARVAPKLFNVHVAAHDIEDATFIEVRSSLIADGLTVDVLERAIALLATGANAVTGDLQAALGPQPAATPGPPPVAINGSAMPTPAAAASAPSVFAGYL